MDRRQGTDPLGQQLAGRTELPLDLGIQRPLLQVGDIDLEQQQLQTAIFGNKSRWGNLPLVMFDSDHCTDFFDQL